MLTLFFSKFFKSPKLTENTDAVIYVGDGRFHLESIMIANETVEAYKFEILLFFIESSHLIDLNNILDMIHIRKYLLMSTMILKK